jgi:hypothetical protein
MSFIQPKPYMDRLRLRNHAIGVERRRNMSKIILENGTPFPKSVEYVDIDKTFFEWVDKKLDIVYNGKKLPTYKLFSNQKLSEYSQTWENLDETGNIIMNFKTITRENNPQHGESQGGNYNVPGNRDYPMFYIPVLQENGEEAYDLYSMKQPLSVNFMYTVSVICNKYEILNKFNEMMHYEFSALECYISPNGYPMPMVIENITDESEYNIDDRKYYSQSYQIKLMAYIIRREDFKVTKVPSRYKVNIISSDLRKKNKKNVPDDCWLGKLNNAATFDKEQSGIENELPKLESNSAFEVCEKPMDLDSPPRHPNVILEEIINPCLPEEKDPYVHKVMKIFIDFPYCEERSVTFTIDSVVDIDTIETTNIQDFVMKINGVVQTFDDEVRLNVGDEIYIGITREDEYGDSSIIIMGTDPETVYDSRINYESALDEPIKEEDIYINKKGTE